MKESYDQIRPTVFEVLKTISNLLQESKIDKLGKTIDEDLTIIIKKDENFEEELIDEHKQDPKEEIKEEQKERKDFLKPPDIFNKKIRIITADYLPYKKIKELNSNFEKVCMSSKKL